MCVGVGQKKEERKQTQSLTKLVHLVDEPINVAHSQQFLDKRFRLKRLETFNVFAGAYTTPMERLSWEW